MDEYILYFHVKQKNTKATNKINERNENKFYTKIPELTEWRIYIHFLISFIQQNLHKIYCQLENWYPVLKCI